MELPKRKNSRLSPLNYNQNGAFFLTICTKKRRKVLSEICVGTPVPGCPQDAFVELPAYGKIAEKYILQMNDFYEHLSVDKFVIMPDHIHLLITLHGSAGHPGTGVPTERTSEIARFVGTLKRFCNKEIGENIWQSRYYDHVIRNQRDYDDIREYMENNPRKWALVRGKI